MHKNVITAARKFTRTFATAREQLNKQNSNDNKVNNQIKELVEKEKKISNADVKEK